MPTAVVARVERGSARHGERLRRTRGHTCPCCGGPMAAFGIEALRFLEVTPTQRKILDAMIEFYPRTVSAREIADRVYALDPSGGPDSGENQMAVQMTKMRPKLRSIGWNIGAAGRRRGGIRLWAPGDSKALR